MDCERKRSVLDHLQRIVKLTLDKLKFQLDEILVIQLDFGNLLRWSEGSYISGNARTMRSQDVAPGEPSLQSVAERISILENEKPNIGATSYTNIKMLISASKLSCVEISEKSIAKDVTVVSEKNVSHNLHETPEYPAEYSRRLPSITSGSVVNKKSEMENICLHFLPNSHMNAQCGMRKRVSLTELDRLSSVIVALDLPVLKVQHGVKQKTSLAKMGSSILPQDSREIRILRPVVSGTRVVPTLYSIQNMNDSQTYVECNNALKYDHALMELENSTQSLSTSQVHAELNAFDICDTLVKNPDVFCDLIQVTAQQSEVMSADIKEFDNSKGLETKLALFEDFSVCKESDMLISSCTMGNENKSTVNSPVGNASIIINNCEVKVASHTGNCIAAKYSETVYDEGVVSANSKQLDIHWIQSEVFSEINYFQSDISNETKTLESKSVYFDYSNELNFSEGSSSHKFVLDTVNYVPRGVFDVTEDSEMKLTSLYGKSDDSFELKFHKLDFSDLSNFSEIEKCEKKLHLHESFEREEFAIKLDRFSVTEESKKILDPPYFSEKEEYEKKLDLSNFPETEMCGKKLYLHEFSETEEFTIKLDHLEFSVTEESEEKLDLPYFSEKREYEKELDLPYFSEKEGYEMELDLPYMSEKEEYEKELDLPDFSEIEMCEKKLDIHEFSETEEFAIKLNHLEFFVTEESEKKQDHPNISETEESVKKRDLPDFYVAEEFKKKLEFPEVSETEQPEDKLDLLNFSVAEKLDLPEFSDSKELGKEQNLPDFYESKESKMDLDLADYCEIMESIINVDLPNFSVTEGCEKQPDLPYFSEKEKSEKKLDLPDYSDTKKSEINLDFPDFSYTKESEIRLNRGDFFETEESEKKVDIPNMSGLNESKIKLDFPDFPVIKNSAIKLALPDFSNTKESDIKSNLLDISETKKSEENLNPIDLCKTKESDNKLDNTDSSEKAELKFDQPDVSCESSNSKKSSQFFVLEELNDSEIIPTPYPTLNKTNKCPGYNSETTKDSATSILDDHLESQECETKSAEYICDVAGKEENSTKNTTNYTDLEELNSDQTDPHLKFDNDMEQDSNIGSSTDHLFIVKSGHCEGHGYDVSVASNQHPFSKTKSVLPFVSSFTGTSLADSQDTNLQTHACKMKLLPSATCRSSVVSKMSNNQGEQSSLAQGSSFVSNTNDSFNIGLHSNSTITRVHPMEYSVISNIENTGMSSGKSHEFLSVSYAGTNRRPSSGIADEIFKDVPKTVVSDNTDEIWEPTSNNSLQEKFGGSCEVPCHSAFCSEEVLYHVCLTPGQPYDVYLTFFIPPRTLWLQMQDCKILEVQDILEHEVTIRKGSEIKKQKLHRGAKVAALYRHDNCYYRA
ncbi:hypothetical protein SK128_006642, partial [Halocaridina rubra]